TLTSCHSHKERHVIPMLFRLSRGRALEFAAYGLPLASCRAAVAGNCITILYHHGWPSCRHEAAFLHPHALDLGLRVLAINRPGVGRTSFDPASYSFQSIANDVRELLDGLGFDKVVFMGASGGGPYACACACLLPERTSALCLVAGMAPTRNAPELRQGMALSNRLGFMAINHLPVMVGATLGAGSTLLRLGAVLGMGPMAAAAWKRAQGDLADVDDVIIDGVDGVTKPGLPPTPSPRQQQQQHGGGHATSSISGVSVTRSDESVARSAADATAHAAEPHNSATVATGSSNRGDRGSGSILAPAAAGGALSATATSLMLLAGGFSSADRASVARHLRQRPELLAMMARSGTEVAMQGFGGLWADMRLTSEPWRLPLERITAPTFIWQGDQDLNVTMAMARHLHNAIPGARGRLRIVEGAGHISLGLDHGKEVLDELVRQLTQSTGSPPGGVGG
ncbi:hypothetical protein VaNZ11_012345, partial [Volvox africanus]